MPRRKRCPICNAKVVPAIITLGVRKKGICSAIANAKNAWGNHYVYQYPVEIIYVDDMSFWSNVEDKKTYVYNNHAPISSGLIATKPIYTPEECIEFHKRWLKAQVLS